MIALILGLALLGLILYLIQTYIPMDPAILVIIRVIVVICVVVYLARLFGIVDLPLPRAR